VVFDPDSKPDIGLELQKVRESKAAWDKPV
jgi:hypothetical protein